jgi:murein hydrolase activator
MRPVALWVCAQLTLSGLAQAQAPGTALKSERAEIQQRLQAEREAMQALRDQRVDVVQLLALVERRGRASAARAATLEAETRLLRGRLALAERQYAVAEAFARVRIEHLRPRLWLLYRVLRRSPLDVLLPARDFAALVRRSRSLRSLVATDLALLEEARHALGLQRSALEQLGALREALTERLRGVADEHALARARREDLAELLASMRAEATQSSRAIRELERAERDVGAMLGELQAALPTFGFGALRGQLLLPAEGGIIEVGFGRVVNPRHNTVTSHRGLDIRAPHGSTVRAIAPGTIVHTGWLRGYGNLMVLDHGMGFHSLVAHLAEMPRTVGERVAAGDRLGTVGDTGSHKGAFVYFEIRHRGRAVDPSLWLRTASARAGP